MGLDALLKRLIVTPVTPHASPDVTQKAACIKDVTPVTPVTCEKTITANDEAILPYDSNREARRQKILAMLEAAPDVQRAITTDAESDPHNVILTVALRGLATCEMMIPKAKYDPWLLMKLTEQCGSQNIH